MMILFEATEKLTKNPDFFLNSEGQKHFFINKTGHKISTDVLGKVIWKSLPGNISEIEDRVSEEINVPNRLLQEFLYVSLHAGLIRSSKEKKGSTVESNYQEIEQSDLVSVIICTRNGEEHISGCLQSLINQTYKNMEIIVVDNGSQDRTLDIIKDNFPEVIIHALGKNIFYPGGVNYGIKKAKGKYFLILNDDVELKNDSLLLLYKKIKSEARVGAVVPMLKFYHLRGILNGIGNQIRNYGWGTDNFVGCVDIGQFSDIHEVPSLCLSAVLLNKEAVNQVGLFDSKYKAYYEDVDWAYRCWLHGWKILAEPQSVVYHKFNAYWRTMERKLKLAARNRLRLVLKIFRGRIMLGYVKRYLIEDLKNIYSFARNKNAAMIMTYIKAYFSLFCSLFDVFLKRRKLMKAKLSHKQEASVIMKNPIWFSCQDENNVPKLDSEVIFGYYRWEIQKSHDISTK